MSRQPNVHVSGVNGTPQPPARHFRPNDPARLSAPQAPAAR